LSWHRYGLVEDEQLKASNVLLSRLAASTYHYLCSDIPLIHLTLSIRPAATFQVRYRLLSFKKKVCMLALIFMKQIENQYESVCSHTQLDGALAPNFP
ncbi:hypothetical protein, partial [Vibrio owensii]